MGSKKSPKAHLWANPDLSRAMHGLRSSNAAQPHVPRPRKGARAERERQVIRDQQKDRGDQ
ncbi:UNVERIFIED_ORG: hypothetical protein ABIB52_000757 [Arthrobacter sp. UYCu721]